MAPKPSTGIPKEGHSEEYPDAKCQIYFMQYYEEIITPLIKSIDDLTSTFKVIANDHDLIKHAIMGNNMDNGLIITTNKNSVAISEIRDTLKELIKETDKNDRKHTTALDAMEKEFGDKILTLTSEIHRNINTQIRGWGFKLLGVIVVFGIAMVKIISSLVLSGVGK